MTGYYKFTCEITGSDPKIIFSNGTGTQTADFDFVNNGVYSASGFTGDHVTGIDNAVVSGISVSVREHRLVITTPVACTVTVVRADGIAFPVNLHIGYNTVDLPRGFYIVAGKKVIL